MNRSRYFLFLFNSQKVTSNVSSAPSPIKQPPPPPHTHTPAIASFPFPVRAFHFRRRFSPLCARSPETDARAAPAPSMGGWVTSALLGEGQSHLNPSEAAGGCLVGFGCIYSLLNAPSRREVGAMWACPHIFKVLLEEGPFCIQ